MKKKCPQSRINFLSTNILWQVIHMQKRIQKNSYRIDIENHRMVGAGRDLWPQWGEIRKPWRTREGKNRISQRQASARVSLASKVRDITFWWKLLEGWIYLISHLVSVGSVQVHLVSIVRKEEWLHWKSMVKLPLASKARDGFLELQQMKNSIKLHYSMCYLGWGRIKWSIKTVLKDLLL